MKPLHELITAEKAWILHKWFPQEIPALIDFVEGMCEAIANEKISDLSEAQATLPAFNYSFAASMLYRKLLKYRGKIATVSKLFSNQLFYGEEGKAMIHFMQVYIETRKHANTKFPQAIALLFL